LALYGTANMRCAVQPTESVGESEFVAQIGRTPVCRLEMRIGAKSRGVYLKLEGENPGGSIKDRTSLSLLRGLEVTGQLRPGGRLVESSSGNLAIGLAILARDRGYRFTAVVDPNVTKEKLHRLHELGAAVEIVETPDDTGGYLLTRLARIRTMLAEDPELAWTNQYSSAANPNAHYWGTAPEILRQMDHKVDAIFVAVSTGGTLAGIGRYFRQASPDTRIIAVDATGSVALGGPAGVRKLTGIGSSRLSQFIEAGHYDDVIYVDDCEAFAFCRAVDDGTGMRMGGSTGASLAACAHYLQAHPTVRRPVVISADLGAHYASSIYSDAWLATNGIDLRPEHLGAVNGFQLCEVVTSLTSGDKLSSLPPERRPQSIG
jgi:2,3-diaminopropionate biosynthesis protein SbnA